MIVSHLRSDATGPKTWKLSDINLKLLLVMLVICHFPFSCVTMVEIMGTGSIGWFYFVDKLKTVLST